MIRKGMGYRGFFNLEPISDIIIIYKGKLFRYKCHKRFEDMSIVEVAEVLVRKSLIMELHNRHTKLCNKNTILY